MEESATALALECRACGECCDFAARDYVLYATDLELAYLAAHVQAPAAAPGACPFLDGGKCTAHRFRPLGCRSYFCKPAGDEWAELVRSWHSRIKRIHSDFGIPYSYFPLLSRLACRQGLSQGADG